MLPRITLALLFLAACLLSASPATAHGPSVRVSYASAKPAVLTIEVGQTVHFQNANSGGGVCTVAADEGAFESPGLTRAEGWHHEFLTAGTFAYHVREFPSVKGTIVVVEP